MIKAINSRCLLVFTNRIVRFCLADYPLGAEAARACEGFDTVSGHSIYDIDHCFSFQHQ